MSSRRGGQNFSMVAVIGLCLFTIMFMVVVHREVLSPIAQNAGTGVLYINEPATRTVHLIPDWDEVQAVCGEVCWHEPCGENTHCEGEGSFCYRSDPYAYGYCAHPLPTQDGSGEGTGVWPNE